MLNTFEDRAESGGFVHLFESARRWRDFDLTVFGPQAARQRVADKLPGADFVPIPSCEGVTRNRLVVHAFRMIAAAVMLPGRLRRFDAIYVLSHSLADLAPAVLASPRRTVAQVFHLQPLPWKRPGSIVNNTFAYANEVLGIGTVRLFVRNVVVLTTLMEPQLRLPSRTRVFVVGSGTWTIPVDGVRRDSAARSGAVYVGRLHPAKGVDDLIAAWAIVHSQVPDAVLTLVGGGDPDFVDSLKARVGALGLGPSVRFAGFVSDLEKANAISSSRVFVSASIEEGWGIAVGEALSLGVPCVTYDLPVYRAVFPGGRIAAPLRDVSAFAAGIVTLLRDDDRNRLLSAQAGELSKDFSWDSVARIEEDAIRAASKTV